MKTKLLKKIRKRYSIHRIDDIGKNPSNKVRWFLAEISPGTGRKVPFYVVRRKNKWHKFYNLVGIFESEQLTQTRKGAYTLLINWVKQEYPRKDKPKSVRIF